MIANAVFFAVVAVAIAAIDFVILPMMLSSGNAIVICIAVVIVLAAIIYGAFRFINNHKEQSK